MNINLTLTQDQLKIINDSLMDAPYKHSAPLIANINFQIQKQFNLKMDEQKTGGEYKQTVDNSPNNF